MTTKLHIGNIPATVSEDDLQTTFTKFGTVDTVQIVRDEVSGLSKGFAIVSMCRDEDAVTAIGRMNFTQYAGRTIGVSRSR